MRRAGSAFAVTPLPTDLNSALDFFDQGPTPVARRKERALEVLHPRCAGLDVHKNTVVACVRLARHGGQAVREVRTFGTPPASLLELAAWLTAQGCPHAAMEATGID